MRLAASEAAFGSGIELRLAALGAALGSDGAAFELCLAAIGAVLGSDGAAFELCLAAIGAAFELLIVAVFRFLCLYIWMTPMTSKEGLIQAICDN